MHTDSTLVPSVGRRAFLCLLAGGAVSLALPPVSIDAKPLPPIRTPLAAYVRPPRNISPQQLAASNVKVIVTTFSREDRLYLTAMREAGWTGKALIYLHWNAAAGPRGNVPANWIPYDNQAAYEKGDVESLPESAFLHEPNGARLGGVEGSKGDQFYSVMNPRSREWRDLFIRRVNALADAHGGLFAGILLDNIDHKWYATRDDGAAGAVREYPTAAEFRAAVLYGLADIKRRIAPAQPGRAWQGAVWGNMIEAPVSTGREWDDMLPSLDGAMLEATFRKYNGEWHTADQVEAQWRQIDTLLTQGKGMLVNTQAPRGGGGANLRWALALFRMIQTDDDRAMFRYCSFGAYNRFTVDSEYRRDLGRPLGPREKVGGNTWRRQFERGTVTVDLARRKVIIR